MPFGDALSSIGSSPIYFTGQERDVESNLDHFWFRQYSSTQGRWMSPDPAGLAVADPTDPQSWNRYSYVTNNPANLTDPSGLDPDFTGCGHDPLCYSQRAANYAQQFSGLGCGPRCLYAVGYFPYLNVYLNLPNMGNPSGIALPQGGYGDGDLIWFPTPPLDQTIWEDVLGLPHVPTMDEVTNPVIMNVTPADCTAQYNDCTKTAHRWGNSCTEKWASIVGGGILVTSVAGGAIIGGPAGAFAGFEIGEKAGWAGAAITASVCIRKREEKKINCAEQAMKCHARAK